jgi:hypothetical protein
MIRYPCRRPAAFVIAAGVVVDTVFKVRGTRPLRVVDAWVFPRIPGVRLLDLDLQGRREGGRHDPARCGAPPRTAAG